MLKKRKIKSVPYKHQIEAVKAGVRALFMEMGTGKSKTSLMMFEDFYTKYGVDQILVICPNAIKSQWTGEVLEEHLPFEYESIEWNGFNSQKDKKAFSSFLKVDNKVKVFAINFEAFSLKKSKVVEYVKQFVTDKTLIIVDESAKIKNPDANRTRLITNLFYENEYKVVLTGTPVTGSPLDLFTQMNFIHNNFFRMKYHNFKLHYSINVKQTNPKTGRPFNRPIDFDTWKRVKNWLEKLKEEYGTLTYHHFMIIADTLQIDTHDIGVINNQKEFSPYKNMNQLKELIAPYVFSVLKEDCLDLPPKVYERLEVDLLPEQKKLIKELKKNFFTEFEGKEITVKDALPIMIYNQMITGGVFPYKYEVKKIVDDEEIYETLTDYKVIENSPKVKALIDDIETLPDNKQLIVWATFRGEFELLEPALEKSGVSFELYYGATPENKRSNIIDKFKKNQFRVLVINPALGETGLNLQNCSLQYFYSNSFQADRRLQAEDRSHRIGQKSTVVYKDIIAKDSIDIKILQALKEKVNIIDYFKGRTKELLK